MEKKSDGLKRKVGRPEKVTRENLADIINSTMPVQERINRVRDLAEGVMMVKDLGEVHCASCGQKLIEESGDAKKAGVVVIVPESKVYREKPDLGALRFLEEYNVGRPVNAIEGASEGDLGAVILIPSQMGVEKARKAYGWRKAEDVEESKN